MTRPRLGRPPKRLQHDGELDTRSRILAVAAQQFGERGYATTSLKAIAEQAAVTPAALYWYFPSKTAILYEFLDLTLRAFIRNVEGSITASDPPAQLRQFVRAHVRWIAEGTIPHLGIQPFGAYYRQRDLSRFLPEKQRYQLNRLQQEHFRFLQRVLRAGIEAGAFRRTDVTATTFAIFSMCDDVTGWWRPEGRLNAEQVANIYEDLVMSMVTGSEDAT
jgi:AcrR family transcriptional regulator